MDPTPQRGVKGAGRGDSSGQYSGALGGSSSERRGGRNHRGGRGAGRPAGSAIFKVKCAERTGGRWGVESLLTVPARARHSHRYLQANDRQSAGIERCCRLDRKCPPPSVLCCQPAPSSATGRGHGATHETDT